MTLSIPAICLLVLLLAWVNGANDIAKGVATLVGNGTAHARRAVLWGTLWTLLGGLAALVWGGALINAFTKGFLNPNCIIDLPFVAGVTLGATAWVGFATRVGLPVSTTHALYWEGLSAQHWWALKQSRARKTFTPVPWPVRHDYHCCSAHSSPSDSA